MAFADIKLGSSFDAKGFKQAESAAKKLTKNVKNLAATFGIAFSTAAVVRFGKAAAKAAADDSKATAVLAQNLTNVGLAYAQIPVENFIKQMQQQTGIVDDELRPAFAKLAQTTMSVTKSQDLMALAFDVSSGSGVDFNSVINTLSQAYLGNTKGLKKLNIQMTATELKTASFAEIQAALTQQFKGSGKAALDTYGGQLQILNTAAAEASETIGYALLDALKSLTGDTDIQKLAKSIDTAAGTAALFIKLTTKNVKPATGLWGYWQGFVESIPGYDKILKNFAKELDVEMFPTGPLGNFQMSTGTVLDQSATQLSKIEQERAKAERERLAKEKALLKQKALAAKKALMDEKARATLSRASATFDLTKIQIAAALRATYDKDERLRLLAMQEIENDNGEAALKYIEQLKLLTAEQQTNKLAGIKTISETELNYINQLLLDELQRIKTTKMSEEEAAAARAAAYAKYNAAIIASGGLASANFYTEKTQVELLAIAKLAALDTVAAAQATIDILNYTSQTDIIARLAAAQLLADDAKAKALSDYLKGYDAGIAAIAASQTLTDAEKLAALTTYLNTASAAITALGGSQKTIDDAKMAALKAYLAEATKPLTQVITIKYDVIGAPPFIPDLPGTNTGPKFGPGGQPLYPDGGGFHDYLPAIGSGSSGSSDNSVTIIVEGNVLDGDDFTDKVNDALLDSIRKGRSQNPAGFIPG